MVAGPDRKDTMDDSPESEIIQRELDTDAESPATQVADIVATIEGKEATDLSTMYACVDGVLDHIFSSPPKPEAQMEVEFSYETHRVRIEQNGTAEFIKTN